MTSQPSRSSFTPGVKAGIWVLVIALVAVAGLIVYLALGRQGTTQPPPVAPTTPATTPTTPTGTSEPTPPEPTPSDTAPTPIFETPPDEDEIPEPEPGQTQTLMWQGKATFEHFTVELMEDSGEGPEVPEGLAVLPVEVCVVKAVDGEDATRISLNPWSLEDSNGRTQRPKNPGPYEPAFPADGTYAVGECATGYLSFDLITDEVDWVNLVYANGLGDRAVWSFH